MKPATRKWFNFFALVVTLVVNWLVSSEIIGNTSISTVAARYGMWFTPSGFTFGIWWIIYIFLIGFAIFQLQTTVSKSNHMRLIGNLFLYTCLFNVLWLVSFQLDIIWLSLLVMISLLVTLIKIYSKLRKDKKFTKAEKWFIKTPFSLYTAWVTLSLIMNVSSFFSKMQMMHNWSFVGIISPTVLTIIHIIIVLIIAVIYLFKKFDPVTTLVFIWALIGLSHRHYTWPNSWFSQGQIAILSTDHFILVSLCVAVIVLLIAFLTRYSLLAKEKRKEIY